MPARRTEAGAGSPSLRLTSSILKVQILMPSGLTVKDDIESATQVDVAGDGSLAPVRPSTNKDHTKVCLFKTNKSPLSPLVRWSKGAKYLDSSVTERRGQRDLAPSALDASKEDLVMLHNRDELDGVLKQAFAEGVRWPIERPSLNALSELGLSVEQIARYFSVDPAEVRAFLKADR
jgi:hypothetical protein